MVKRYIRGVSKAALTEPKTIQVDRPQHQCGGEETATLSALTATREPQLIVEGLPLGDNPILTSSNYYIVYENGAIAYQLNDPVTVRGIAVSPTMIPLVNIAGVPIGAREVGRVITVELCINFAGSLSYRELTTLIEPTDSPLYLRGDDQVRHPITITDQECDLGMRRMLICARLIDSNSVTRGAEL